ncbi:hypothetical protein K458DRAFT_448375 [Lentithecium fluviatile CBS 122367]|uniref:Uncharacterized protein n=1 Tax=Lentithecium fluviatile CBS 122367 TaxID=1168545 RepID=A0A6G1JNJ4_9PLEO|nr:hypothetical protein K458DRAFT_448375 [Lentithecium fluviatile CBS 122367]
MSRYEVPDTQWSFRRNEPQDSSDEASSESELIYEASEVDPEDLSIDMVGTAPAHRTPVHLPNQSRRQAAAEGMIMATPGFWMPSSVIREQRTAFNLGKSTLFPCCPVSRGPSSTVPSKGTLAYECLPEQYEVCTLITCPHSKTENEWLMETLKPGTSEPQQYTADFSRTAMESRHHHLILCVSRKNSGNTFREIRLPSIRPLKLTITNENDPRRKIPRTDTTTSSTAKSVVRSKYSHVGMGQYEQEESTIRLKKLVHAAIKTLLPSKSSDFHSFKIAFLALPDQVPFSERLFIRCLSFRVEEGGFCVTAPGQCSSANEITAERWEELKRLRDECSPCIENLKEEIVRMQTNPQTPIEKLIRELEAEGEHLTKMLKKVEDNKKKLYEERAEIDELLETLDGEAKAFVEGALAILDGVMS